jgi:hypothetical protein
MAGTHAETQQRRAEKMAQSRRIRASLEESFRVNDSEEQAEQDIDPQLVEAFEKLCDHTVTKEECTTFLTRMEREGYQREDITWDFIRWVSLVQRHWILEKETEIRDLGGEIQVMDADLDEARKDLAQAQAQLEEQRGIVRALVTGSRQASVSPAPNQASATSKKFPDPSVWKNGTPSEWKQWKMSLHAKFRNNADWYPSEDARKDYFMKVVADESWEIAEPYFQDDAASVDDILKALDYRWADPMEKQTARNEYQSYLQLNKPFAEFIAKFQTLARTAEIPEEIQIDDLRAKISFDLQDHASSFEPKGLRDFITYLQRTARNLEQVKQQRQRVTQARRNKAGPAGSSTQRLATTPSQLPAQAPQPTQRQSNTKDNSDKECLNCGKKGHVYRDCREPAQPGKDERVAAMRKRFEAKKAMTQGDRIYELDGQAHSDEDFDSQVNAENE